MEGASYIGWWGRTTDWLAVQDYGFVVHMMNGSTTQDRKYHKSPVVLESKNPRRLQQ